MTTFKNNSKYAEVLFTYLDVAYRGDTPLKVEEVLETIHWNFKGGSLKAASESTRLSPQVSSHVYPHGMSTDIACKWPYGDDACALRDILVNRRVDGKLRNRGVLARVGTWKMLVGRYDQSLSQVQLKSGMCAIYRCLDAVWDGAKKIPKPKEYDQMADYVAELTLGSAQVSRQHVPTVDMCRQHLFHLLGRSRFPGLMKAVLDVKAMIKEMFGARTRRIARSVGLEERRRWGYNTGEALIRTQNIEDMKDMSSLIRCRVGPVTFLVVQGAAMLGLGQTRFVLGKSDVERFHQVLMSAASAIYGVCAQAVVGTTLQKQVAQQAVEVAQDNIQRIIVSSRKVPLGDEVLVCKGYRRAYTAHLAVLAGPLCAKEREELIEEAKATAETGVIDVEGMLADLASLSADAGLNAAKMFKICPAPDVSPGYAMMDRIKQIGDGNVVDRDMMGLFEEELRTQILRAYIRSRKDRLELRDMSREPRWYREYLKGQYDEVPSSEIHEYLAWEGTGEMPDISPHDPAMWKDSGLGADDETTAMGKSSLGKKANMMTRLVYDESCPMPGEKKVANSHVIKFFVKAEGHKDPARGIFSANLTDRQAQSWMERAVEGVARQHPSFMIGTQIDDREAKVAELVELPRRVGEVALYYSFDISGWSAKMPAEPQHISHSIWSSLFGGHLFEKATEINEGAFTYLNMDGYKGWFKNTHANLEGFNGKEMTMVLVALLSLSVRRWRVKVAEERVMSQVAADYTAALLFAYIDDGLCRIDLPKDKAVAAFEVYKNTVIETFAMCGFTVEVSKCFPSDRFAIFLNEVYLAGRHVVHGVRAAMGISAEPTERHTSLIERVTSVSTGCRGAVMAGLNGLSATLLMGYHTFLHLLEWVDERDPTILSAWSLAPRAWGGLGLPNTLQLAVSGSGSAFEEGVSTLQAYAKLNVAVKKAFIKLVKTRLMKRNALSVLTAPLSGRVESGYMVDSRVPVAIRKGLVAAMERGEISTYATRLLRYGSNTEFAKYAEAVVAVGYKEVIQEQMLNNLSECHPHSIFSAFARRLEKSMTILSIVGRDIFSAIAKENKADARASVDVFRNHLYG